MGREEEEEMIKVWYLWVAILVVGEMGFVMGIVDAQSYGSRYWGDPHFVKWQLISMGIWLGVWAVMFGINLLMRRRKAP